MVRVYLYYTFFNLIRYVCADPGPHPWCDSWSVFTHRCLPATY